MDNDPLKHKSKKLPGKSRSRKFLIGLLVIAIIAAGFIGFKFYKGVGLRADNSGKKSGIYIVGRGGLTISVTESGDIKAVNSKDIKSEVEGRTTIISIVDEGTVITAEDVNSGKILVELDSSEIKERLTRQEIDYLNASSNYTEAKESLDIQIKQNESDIHAGQMKVRFALMDLKKYLGEKVSQKIIDVNSSDIEDGKLISLVDDVDLGGEALQKKREFNGDISLKEQQLELAKSKLDWTEKLYKKKYVSKNDKEADTLDKATKEIAWEKAKTAKDLFVKYEFPKQTEKLLSDYQEAKRELDRIEARARSKLAQAQTKLESREATYLVQTERLKKLQKQLKACIIRAPSPGQVVYSSSMLNEWERRNRAIEIGAEIRERQKIIVIPDQTEMKVEIKIHEVWIDKIELGQTSKITITAFPEKVFTGKVIKKAPLADQQNWMSPDLKVYVTDVKIDGSYDYLKTGMTGKVEIIISELKNVISVPIQSVVNHEGKKLCYIMTGSKPESREVETGAFNNDFVEIKSGLKEGDEILLNPPRLVKSK